METPRVWIVNGGKANGSIHNYNGICENEKTMKKPSSTSTDSIINLDQGDPKIFECYWKENAEKCSITIGAAELVSYFSDARNMCWFMEPAFGDAVRRLHARVGNAVTEGRHLVVGTGSTQLYQAALYALSSTIADHRSLPLSVVAAAPYYSNYPLVTDILQSGLYKWAGDANAFRNSNKEEEEEAYIEVVCSPNNPDGAIPKPTDLKIKKNAKLIHDLAYYWPHYTPITSPAHHDIMLFTVSKCTGHAGSRLGWAIVKDEVVAKNMIKFIEVSTIGTSKEAQLRAAKILNSICDEREGFFEYGHRAMAGRWQKLREAMTRNPSFTLPIFPLNYCHFMGKFTTPNPGFAWMECKEGEDGCALMKEQKIVGRSGTRFGVDNKYVRISMLDTEESFNIFLQRMAIM
ncbi:hypothetical protein V2J09_013117 [Rumex salicifolius]